MRLDDLSFGQLLKIFNPQIAKRNVNMGKNSHPFSVYLLRYAV